MSTPQDPARRLKQKRRRSTQLAAWRARQTPTDAPAGDVKAAAPKAAAPKAAAPKTEAKAAPAKA